MPGIYRKNRKLNSQAGFSMIELLVVVLVISVLSVFTLISFKSEKKYSADTQSYMIIDVLHEARQRALTQHETMRVEINQTRNTVRLISENEPGDATDDKEIKTLKLLNSATVAVGAAPKNVFKPPTEMSPTPVLPFKKSVYPLSLSDSVITLRFLTNGTVLDAGSNATGDNATMTGATIYVWMPDSSASGQSLTTGSIIRAITVQGTSGLSRFWRCQVVNSSCETWVE